MIKGAEMEEPQVTLRETLESNFDSLDKGEPEAPVTEKTDRARDEAGRFAAKEEAKPEAKVEAKLEPAPKVEAKPQPEPVQPAPEPVEAIKRPSSWKKEYWPVWDKLTKGEPLSKEEAVSLAKYNLERENDLVKGVSTYKAEYDRAKPIVEALAPFQPMMQSANLRPEEFVSRLAHAHQTLTYGDPQAKLKAFAQFVQDYQIPVHELLIQGEDGKVYFNQQYFKQEQQQPQGLTPEQVDQMLERKLAQNMWHQTIQSFVTATDDKGNPRYPHFEEVKATMDGLLRAGLAKDLPGAYERALRLPEHSHILEAQQRQQRETEEREKQRLAAEAAQRAKRDRVSVRSSAPTGMAHAEKSGKGLRELLSDGIEEVTSRV